MKNVIIAEDMPIVQDVGGEKTGGVVLVSWSLGNVWSLAMFAIRFECVVYWRVGAVGSLKLIMLSAQSTAMVVVPADLVHCLVIVSW